MIFPTICDEFSHLSSLKTDITSNITDNNFNALGLSVSVTSFIAKGQEN